MRSATAGAAAFRFGIDRLLQDARLQQALSARRVGLLAHPASLTCELEHSLDVLMKTSIEVAVLFGPQHGVRGDKQDNMVETEHATDPVYNIPAFSLYGEVRRPSQEMLDQFDVLLVDLQDVGCRIYTFLTTLFYLIEDCAHAGKSLWVLDRPNPAGRPVEGLSLLPGHESFVGAAPIPMRHGLTLGEAARWFRSSRALDVDLQVVTMDNYAPAEPPGFGWPQAQPWINPSPNLATLNSARVYSGTVILEGTTLSEGRGTTRPLEVIGAPGLPVGEIIQLMRGLSPDWLQGCHLRPCYFEPTFHKYAGESCAGVHIHADHAAYDHHRFRPFRLVLLFLKALRTIRPEYDIWRDFPYEYVTDRLAIDVINGGPTAREWVDDAAATVADLETELDRDETEWKRASSDFYLY